MCDANWVGDLLVALATVVAAIVGGALALFINQAADKRRTANEKAAEQRRRADDHEAQILKALEFLTGGTQKRSAGVGLLEGFLPTKPDDKLIRSIFLPVIRNQLIYLATSTDSKGELHEQDNFVRLVGIWTRLNPDSEEKNSLSKILDLRDSTRGLDFSGTFLDEFNKFSSSLKRS